ncbi:hypothetical protein NLM33_37155 [Bradyrhizobium sp. CCGUVB1N3]|uniref:hypothetical protein n=1 Tax=Bradyrhizobium sp. CCGUVB1N3 TaxID=2949629 RepID=UPI0020B2690C|nr:hypothetical protein [Bradyrhizobium sp. CCGUVB1N3]MCP3475876.1 hypothetical protein [Bradyrhizobium sp. CCGUVB1N3]
MPGQGSRRTPNRDLLLTTNSIESLFGTGQYRSMRANGSLMPTTARPMVLELVIAA